MAVLPTIDHIYIVHYPPAVRRRAAMDAWIGEMGFPQGYAEYRSRYIAENLTPEIIGAHYAPEKSEHAARIREVLGDSPLSLRYPLTAREIAVGIEHIEILRDACAKGYGRVLVLEDDALFVSGFASRFASLMEELPADADVVSLGDGCNLHIDHEPYLVPITKDKRLYKNPLHRGRAADSYIMTASAIKRVLPEMQPFALPIDWELSRAFIRRTLNVYWAEPVLVTQGSFIGRYPSFVR